MKLIFENNGGEYKSECGQFKIERLYNLAALSGNFMLTVTISGTFLPKRYYGATVDALMATAETLTD